MKRILVGMSGGVDSALTAALLQKEGYSVVGAYCIMHEYAAAGLKDAQKIAEQQHIELQVIDLTDRFQRIVVTDFLTEYAKARTPNPCVICNPSVKFHALLQCADELGIDLVATGHYAAVEQDRKSGRFCIRTVTDKDQSYMLCRLTQEQLARVRFPLANTVKTKNRDLAREFGIPVAEKPDSQEICFIQGETYADFIERRQGEFSPGNFRLQDEDRIVGQHRGLIRYTVGQRKNLGIALGAPVYVTRLDAEHNEVVLSYHDVTDCREITVTDPVFQRLSPETDSFTAFAKIRYAARPAPCTVTKDKDRFIVRFDLPQRAATPGQSAVFYDAEGRILCAGFIKE